MAVTQIIGPRIAPVWADPAEWTSTRAYEPFTFVTYQGDSYCSRQDTPIGIDITNDDYWVKVSDYNAQAVALQRSMTQTIETAETNMANTIQSAENAMTEQVNAVESVKNEFQTQLDAVELVTPFDASPISGSNKGVTSDGLYNAINKPKDVLVWIGDSYSDPDIVPLDWVPIVANSINAELHTYAKSGAGFTNGRLFQTQIESAVNDTSFDNNKVKNIVIYGGNNDIGHWISHYSEYSWYNIFYNFFRTIHDHFPNATTHIAVPNVNGNLVRASYYGYCQTIYAAASEGASKNHILHNVDGWQNFNGFPNGYLSETNEHPGSYMCYELVRIFVDAISGSDEYGKLNSISVTENISGVIVGQSVSKYVSVAGLLPFFVIITAPSGGIAANTDIFTIGSEKQLFNSFNWRVGDYNFYMGNHGNVRTYNAIPEGTTVSIPIPAMNWRN